jgi:hypothetical protein
MAHGVFISYSYKDKTIADAIVAAMGKKAYPLLVCPQGCQT